MPPWHSIRSGFDRGSVGAERDGRETVDSQARVIMPPFGSSASECTKAWLLRLGPNSHNRVRGCFERLPDRSAAPPGWLWAGVGFAVSRWPRENAARPSPTGALI